MCFKICVPCARGEMDITTGFGPVIVGSNPAGRSKKEIIFCGYILDISAALESHIRASSYATSFVCGYSLVVERILAKDKTGVRFSLPAHEAHKTYA